MKIVYLVTATAILLSISTFAFAAAGHDNLRERAAFSKTISGQILGKYAIRKAEDDRAKVINRMTKQGRTKVDGWKKGDKMYTWSPRTDD